MTDHDRELDEIGARLAGPLRAAERLPEDFEARLLARVRAEMRAEGAAAGAAGDIPRGAHADIPRGARPSRRDVADLGAWRQAKRWMFQPHAVTVTPARGLLAAAALVLAAVLGGRMAGTERAEREQVVDTVAQQAAMPAATAAATDTVRLVQFVLVAPEARTVSVVGDFNDWAADKTPLRAVGGNGVWSVEVPLQAGRYQYAFIVNGERWVADPTAPRAVEESFGSPSSVVTVGERSS
jgi:hypothetical protein